MLIKSECEHCRGHIEFDHEAIGQAVQCPHCDKQTTLRSSTASAICVLTVRRVVEVVAAYLNRGELKREYPELEEEDMREATAYVASHRLCCEILLAKTPPVG